jgi:hypothetical protein
MQDRQSDSELAVFRAFVEAQALPIKGDSVQKRPPPEPDILCQVDGLGSLAFELVEIINSDLARWVNEQIRLEKALQLSADSGPSSHALSDSFRDGLIYVRWQGNVGAGQRERSIPELFEFLLSLADGFQGNVEPPAGSLLSGIVRSVRVSRGDYGPGPHFQVEAGGMIANPILECLRSKLRKGYRTEHHIELLAYYELHPVGPPAMWLEKVQSFLGENLAESPFCRVWVFDVAKRNILLSVSR